MPKKRKPGRPFRKPVYSDAKRLFVKKLYKTYGINHSDGYVLYELLVDTLGDVFAENRDIFIEKLGRMSHQAWRKDCDLKWHFVASDTLWKKIKRRRDAEREQKTTQIHENGRKGNN